MLSGGVGTAMEYFVGQYVGAGEYSGVSYEENANSGIRSWDYRGSQFNYKGIISVRHFITWGIAGIAVAKLTPHLEKSIAAGLRA